MLYRFNIILLMKQHDKICHRIAIKSQKERELYRKREERPIEGTPKIILGKDQGNIQEIWVQDLKAQPIARLKESNNSERAHIYAKTIAKACASLASHYGFFIINENMIFTNPQRSIFAWINPDIRENHVKIYLPHTHEGELAMIRSIITYFKLWLKIDYSLLADVKHLVELVHKLDTIKFKPTEGFKAKSPEREFIMNRRNSVNVDAQDLPQRQEQAKMHLLVENKSMKNMMGRSPGKESDSGNFLTSSLSNKMSSPLKFTHLGSTNQKEPFKNKTTLVSEKNGLEGQFEHRTFNNLNSGAMMTPLNKSVGVAGGNHYYPNKTTSNKANSKHHIVAMINQQDTSPHEYGKNKILLDQRKMTQQQLLQRAKKGKESLDGIGEQLNDLFLSNIENEEEGQQTLKQVEEEFSSLLE